MTIKLLRRYNPIVALLAGALSSGTALCQPATPPAAPPTAPSDQVVNLDAFEVTGDAMSGYVASESTTGTRTATKIADLPFVVNVLTKDFLNDFDFFSIASELGYTSSLSNVDTEGNANLRGFATTFQEWNGFYRLGLLDRANIDRIEIIKGPSASIYGQTAPAGIIDYITTRPSFRDHEDLTATVGSDDLRRVEGHVDTVLGPIAGVQVGNLISFDGMDTLADTKYFYQHQRSFADALQFKLNDHSSLLLQVDWDKILSNTGDFEGLFNYNSATKAYYGTIAPLSLARFSQGGPNERQNRELTDFYSVYENRISDIWSVRLSGYGYDRHNSEVYNGVSNEYDPVLGQVVGISQKPTRTILNEDGGAGDADLLAHWFAFDQAMENNTLLTFDYSQNWRYRLGSSLPSTISKLLPAAQDPNNPIYNTVPDYGSWTVVTRNDKTRWDTIGLFAREQATFLKSDEFPNGRLLVFGGMRHDQVTYNLNFGSQYSTTAPFAVATPGQVQHFVNSAYTPASGVNFKLTQNIALYANYSQSFQATAQSAKLGDSELPNTRGVGEDYGIKANFLSNRLQFTLGGFYITETGIKVTEVDPVTGVSESVAGGSQNSKGLEFDGTYQVTDSLYVSAGYGHVDPRLLNEGTVTGGAPSPLDGRRAATIPLENAYGVLTYNFRDLGWTGLSFHAGVRYDGISYPESTATTAGESGIVIPSYYVVEAGLSYRWTQQAFGARLNHSIGFSIDNLLNSAYIDVGDNPGPSRGFYFRYSISH